MMKAGSGLSCVLTSCLIWPYLAIMPIPQGTGAEQCLRIRVTRACLIYLANLQAGGPNLAVLDGRSSGIQFGAEGLTIGLQPSQVTLSSTSDWYDGTTNNH